MRAPVYALQGEPGSVPGTTERKRTAYADIAPVQVGFVTWFSVYGCNPELLSLSHVWEDDSILYMSGVASEAHGHVGIPPAHCSVCLLMAVYMGRTNAKHGWESSRERAAQADPTNNPLTHSPCMLQKRWSGSLLNYAFRVSARASPLLHSAFLPITMMPKCYDLLGSGAPSVDVGRLDKSRTKVVHCSTLLL